MSICRAIMSETRGRPSCPTTSSPSPAASSTNRLVQTRPRPRRRVRHLRRGARQALPRTEDPGASPRLLGPRRRRPEAPPPPLPPFTERKRGVLPELRHHPRLRRRPATELAMTVDPDRTTATITVSTPTSPPSPSPLHPRRTLRPRQTHRTPLQTPARAELNFTRGEATGPILHLEVSPETSTAHCCSPTRSCAPATEQDWTPDPTARTRAARPPPLLRPPARTQTAPWPAVRRPRRRRPPHRILIEERFELRELPPTAADLAKQKKYPYLRLEKRHEKLWSGRLRLKRPGDHYPYGIDGKSWYETAHRTWTR